MPVISLNYSGMNKWMSPPYLLATSVFPFNIQTQTWPLRLHFTHVIVLIFRRTFQSEFLQNDYDQFPLDYVSILFLLLFFFIILLLSLTVDWKVWLKQSCCSKREAQLTLCIYRTLNSKCDHQEKNICCIWWLLWIRLWPTDEWMHEQTLNCSWGTGVISEDWLKQGWWFTLIFDAFSTTECII